MAIPDFEQQDLVMNFSIDLFPLIIIILFALLAVFGTRWKQTFPFPHWKFSLLPSISAPAKTILTSLPEWLLWAAWGLLLLAFIDPHFVVPKPLDKGLEQALKNPVEGIAIYLDLDQSGSMTEKINRTQSKLDLMKQVAAQFVEGRPNDMIGLVTFARGASVQAPLTLDHADILKKLAALNVVPTREQDGTAIGYAIYKTASLIAATRHYAEELIASGKPAYDIKSSVIILVTDGMQDPNPLDKGKRLRNIDIPDAALYAKEHGIRLYAIIIEPKLLTEEFAPYRHMMQRVTETTGGKFYAMNVTGNLKQIFQEIDRLEKSSLPVPIEKSPDLFRRISLYPYLIGLALMCFLAYVLFETAIARRIP